MAEYIEHTCGECLHSEICEHLPTLTGWDARNLAYCRTFRNAADVAPVVHGRWVSWGKSGTPTYENYGTCSVCHEDAEIHTEHRNYCPNCGAKMDAEV